MSDPKRPKAEEAMLRLLVEDADEYERMLAEGHRELCLEYQSFIPGIVDAAVVGRQLTGELKEARDYLQECTICAEGLESSSKALRELAAEDGQDEDEPYEPPRPDPPPVTMKEPGKVEQWWIRFTKSRAGLISLVGAMFCVVALVGLFLHSGRQCDREEARRDRQDASVSVPPSSDGGASPNPRDAFVDPRSWLRKKGPLTVVFITLHLAGERQSTSLKALLAAEGELVKLGKDGMTPAAAWKRLALTIQSEASAVGRLAGPLKRAATFVGKVKNDGMTPDFAVQLAAAKKQLASRRKAQARLEKLIAAANKRLTQLNKKAPR